MSTPESRLKERVAKYLQKRGIFYFMPRPTQWGKNGVDFLCCYRGTFVAIETKIWPRKATPMQKLFLDSVRESGGIAFVAYEVENVKANLP